MSDQVPVFNYQSYSTGVELLAQQMSSQTRQAVREESMSGKRHAFDQVGAVRMKKKEGRATDIPSVNTLHARRWVTAQDFYIRDFVDEFDKLKILNDPTNAYTQAFAAAASRELDKTVIDAALGTAYIGEDGTESVALPNEQKIAAGGTGFTLEKLQEASEKLKAANALMPGDTCHVFWTARQEREFINTNQVSSVDFNRERVLPDGTVKYFYGCHFHLLEDDAEIGHLLPKSGSTRSCAMFLRSGINLGTWKAPYGRVAWIDERESYQVMAGMSIGAVRMQDSKVIEIAVEES